MWCSRIPGCATFLVLFTRLTFPKPLPDRELRHPDDKELFQSSLSGQSVEGLTTIWNLPRTTMPATPKMKLPQHMIDLYNQYADDKTSMPMAKIIGSFDVEDVLISSSRRGCTYSQILLFNVTIPKHELLTKAELKLKISLGEWGIGQLTVYDVVHNEQSDNSERSDRFLASKDVENNESITINVTKAVKRWIESKARNHKLNITLKAKKGQNNCAKSGMVGVSIDSSHPPTIIIFSDVQRSQMKETKKELSQMILHEKDKNLGILFNNNTATHDVWGTQSEGRTRSKRSTGGGLCTKESLMVNFKDIGWDAFIVFPSHFDAGQCVGKCTYPLTESMMSTKHAIIQSLMHKEKPQNVDIPCCVPTKFEPVQTLFKEPNKPVIVKLYQDIKVVECGCR